MYTYWTLGKFLISTNLFHWESEALIESGVFNGNNKWIAKLLEDITNCIECHLEF